MTSDEMNRELRDLTVAIGAPVAILVILLAVGVPSLDTGIVTLSVGLPLLAALYFLPSIIAGFSRHRNVVAICALNLLAGWSVIGWLVALVWALMQQPGPRRAGE